MPDAPRRADRSIVLVGLMGVGKSTVGRLLAARLGLPFVDADQEIEAAEGLSVAEMFERHGEPWFRSRERGTMAQLVTGSAKVIGAGGGAFVDAATRQIVLASCIAIWLDADLDTLVGRVIGRDHRPLLRGKDEAGVRAVLADLASRRAPFYAQAHHRIAVDSGPADQVVDRIVALLPEEYW